MGVIEFQPKQHCRSIDSPIDLFFPMLLEAQHSLVELDVTRVDLDEQIGMFLNVSRVNVRNMIQRGEYPLRPDVAVHGQFGEFAELVTLLAQGVDFSFVEFVDQKPDGRIETQADGSDDLVA